MRPYRIGSPERRPTPPRRNRRTTGPTSALIGAGGRGTDVTKWAAKFGEIVAVCDVDLRQAEKAKAKFGGKPDVYQDYRKLLERKDIDAIVNATPDHWHTAINIAACKAGKDVYAEKPLTLTIDEGKLLCKVVEETGRIVQVGTHARSDRRIPDGRGAGPQRADRQAAAGLGRAAVLHAPRRTVSPSSRCRRN